MLAGAEEKILPIETAGLAKAVELVNQTAEKIIQISKEAM